MIDKPPTSDSVRRPRVAELVASTLRNRILSGDLRDNAALPKHDELFAEFGVSMPSIREALRILETEGLITVRRGARGGAIVHRPDPTTAGYVVGLLMQANRIDVATDFATTHRVYVVLKGHRTVIATPEGHVFINPTGNPGMATGGTGDVLTGMIAAWLAQLLDAEAACRLAVFLHGAAGDLAEADEGQVAMTATDVIANLGGALNRLCNPESTQG